MEFTRSGDLLQLRRVLDAWRSCTVRAQFQETLHLLGRQLAQRPQTTIAQVVDVVHAIGRPVFGSGR
ncbi:MAG: hypothetical protein H6812_11775 [Phycisphaeraceae bacterium]|nr:hypothetical protein [Phycisphaeraceae bacterium]